MERGLLQSARHAPAWPHPDHRAPSISLAAQRGTVSRASDWWLEKSKSWVWTLAMLTYMGCGGICPITWAHRGEVSAPLQYWTLRISSFRYAGLTLLFERSWEENHTAHDLNFMLWQRSTDLTLISTAQATKGTVASIQQSSQASESWLHSRTAAWPRLAASIEVEWSRELRDSSTLCNGAAAPVLRVWSCVSTSSRPGVCVGRPTRASKDAAPAPNGAPRSGLGGDARQATRPTFAGRLVRPYW